MKQSICDCRLPCPGVRGKNRSRVFHRKYFLLEPVASTKPKFPMTENSRTYTVHCDQPLTLMCPAQAFPVPAFRCIYADIDARLIKGITSLREESYEFSRAHRRILRQMFLEPVASTRPKFPSLADSQTFKVTLGGAMTLLCPAQGFPVPSYSTRPQLSGPSDLQRFSVSSLKSVTLLCPAQGFPVPLYR
ncbi:unnamed protein product [Heterotrigona itama]|uniref:Ig-like domain-containing protein n=1 Tax=Heterotrigona itama TaxID=395501 RepID=A0A6V7H8Q7_9HYME|nr:unnamed protein product [Heterotrigona itama]